MFKRRETPHRYKWYGRNRKYVVDFVDNRVLNKHILAPHGCVLVDNCIQFRPAGGKPLAKFDLVDYLNFRHSPNFPYSYVYFEHYEPHLCYDIEDRGIYDMWSHRESSFSFLVTDRYNVLENERVCYTTPRGKSRKTKFSDIIRRFEMHRKQDLPTPMCKWLYAYSSTRGLGDHIIDEWFANIDVGHHILDTAPYDGRVVENAKIYKYYRWIKNGESICANEVQSQVQYEGILTGLFESDGAFCQEMKLGEHTDPLFNGTDEDVALRTSEPHWFGFIYQKPLGFFMDPNSGCVVCYGREALIKVCKRFLQLEIAGNLSNLQCLRIFRVNCSRRRSSYVNHI